VGGKVQEAKLIKRVMPVYPVLARQARISGTVHLMAVIAKDGAIQDLRVLSGHPLLIASAVNAVRQWVYRPTLLNGQPMEVMAPIDVIFTLSQ
jgi:protein TonB